MAKGPGRYDAECTKAREETKADVLVLIVVNGNKGSGFSVQSTMDVSDQLPSLLEDIAKDLRKDREPKNNLEE